MPQIVLPCLVKSVWKKQGSKNEINQYLDDAFTIEILNSVVSGPNYLVISDGTRDICLTHKDDSFPDYYEYVIKTMKKPTLSNVSDNSVVLVKWLKHPQDREYSIDKIRDSWVNNFFFKEENNQEKIQGLREPQIAAIYAILSHLKIARDTATVVMPTGTGKTETMLGTLVAHRCDKVLITVPSDALRTQTYNKFLTLGLLKEFGILGQAGLMPKVGIIKEKFIDVNELQDFFSNANVIIASMQILAGSSSEHQKKIADICTHLFIDEAHHVESPSWDAFRRNFKKEKVLQFTATPFRNDEKRLEGKIIFDFPLQRAQEQGYFKTINFVPIREYDIHKSDKVIAQKAVEILKEDIENGYNHILMARCENRPKAENVFEIYKEYKELNPVLIHSKVKDKKNILQKIQEGKHKIIVAVNMLGEGFDLPELKIAAFHDIRKSLPVTLQFAGRFTRTSKDTELGEASFIANIADVKVQSELSNLYAQDSNWNHMLSTLSNSEIEEQLNFEEFIKGFQKFDNSSIPFQNITPALSAVVYKSRNDDWCTNTFENEFKGFKDAEFKFYDINHDKKMIVAVTAHINQVDWGNIKDLNGLDWNLTIIFWESHNKLVFIHSTDRSHLYKDLAKVIGGEDVKLINEIDIFKAFYGINRVTLQNIGLREFLGKMIRFRMSSGTDVEEALTTAELNKGQKAFVFGNGYENGEKVTLGCSYKGRIWSHAKGNLRQFTDWCIAIGNKLTNNLIDPNIILKETILPTIKSERPDKFPISIDWDEDVYNHAETRMNISIDNKVYNLSNIDLEISNPSDRGDLFFDIVAEDKNVSFKLTLFTANSDEVEYADFSVDKISEDNVYVNIGNKNWTASEYFTENVPTVWFADGSSLRGNHYMELRQTIKPYPKEKIMTWDWNGTDLAKEAQGVYPKITDSIQYKTIEKLREADFDIIYDDDYSGEIADVITIKENNSKIAIQLYHLKFAKGGTVSNRIDNFYEVCGQAQKSIHWKHKNASEFIEHLMRRETKKKNHNTCSRLEKGTMDDLERLFRVAKQLKPVEFEVFIVQPGCSKEHITENILTLIGVTENYLKEFAAMKLTVISSL